MLAYLQSRGMLRREAKPSTDLVRELFASIALQISCQACGGSGVAIHEDWTDDWSDETRCEGCQAVIPAERLEVFPETTRCPACQVKHESGEDVQQESEYCPSCGGLLKLAKRSGTGLAGYRLVCTDCRRSA